MYFLIHNFIAFFSILIQLDSVNKQINKITFKNKFSVF